MHIDFYVYEFYRVEDNHVFYVGKGRQNRINELHNRNRYFKNFYNKYNCKSRKVATGLTNEQAKELEKQLIRKYKSQEQCECNFTLGGDGFSEGELNPKYINPPIGEKNPMYGVRLYGELNGFYGKHHSEETKKLISEHRKGKGGQFGKDNPMYGVRKFGKDNPMYGKTGFKHHNSHMFKFQLDGQEPQYLTAGGCVKKFGIAFTRISENGGVLHYKKNTPNKVLYEGLILEKVN